MSKRRKTRTRGLYLNEAGYYEIDKRIAGDRIAKTTGYREGKIEEAEALLSHLIEQHRRRTTYGDRPSYLFEEMAAEFLSRNQDKATIKDVAGFIERLLPYFGGVAIHHIYDDCKQVKALRHDLKKKGRKNGTINAYIEVLRRMLNQAQDWRDKYGVRWLDRAPRFKTEDLGDRRPPRPITWEEQAALLGALPPHLERMALFILNTGARDWGACHLQWEWERETDYGMAFEIIPEHPRQKEKGLLICNSVAKNIVESLRGKHETHVFTYRNKPVTRVINTAWKRARAQAGMPDLHAHDLRHTYGYRLREAKVGEEDRRDLLRHGKKSITNHYSAADIRHLFECAERIAKISSSAPVLRVVRR